MTFKIKTLLAAAALALPLAGQASELLLDTWTEFYFGASGSPLLDLPAYDDTAAPLSFSFVASTPVLLRVTDLNLAGDQFQLLLDGQALGHTSAPVGTPAVDLGADYETAYADTLGSHGAWVLSAGSHTLSGSALASALGAGNGALQISAVPEAGSTAALLAGLAALAAITGRRHRAARR